MKLKNPFKGKKKEKAVEEETNGSENNKEAETKEGPKVEPTKKTTAEAETKTKEDAPDLKPEKSKDDPPKPKKEPKKPSKKKTASPASAAAAAPAPSGPPPSEASAPTEDEYVNPNLGNSNTYEEQTEECAFAQLGHIPTIMEKDVDTRTEFPRFVYKKFKCEGTFEFATRGKEHEIKRKSILKKGLVEFKQNPAKWISMSYQTNTTSWPSKEQEYFMVERAGTVQLFPKGIRDDGWMTVLMQEYIHLPTFPNNELPMEFRDQYTDDMIHHGVKIHSDTIKPILPGRGMGCADTPLIKVIGDIDPNDIKQGQVGCCWLLSAISALAEFDGAVKKLFRKTPDLHLMPMATPNMYTITLWDLPTWTEVDIVVDERLAADPSGKYKTPTVLSSKPSEDGELWVCYLEKALAVHCGGWDAITGGQCTHAWSLMTGCKEQYIIMRSYTGKWACYARYNPHTHEWMPHDNDVHKCDNVTGVFAIPFPTVGDNTETGDKNNEMTDDELFRKMYACDQLNYIVGAASKSGGTDSGLVDNHAYTVIEAVQDAAGTGIDMYKVRNPWGAGEIEDGMFDDDGPGWDQYPQIKALLNPVVADDGIFWVTKEEFFKMFKSVFISASNMTRFLED